MHSRPLLRRDDMDAVHRLFERCRSTDGHAPIGENKYLDLLNSESGTSLRCIFEVEDELIAYVHLGRQFVDADWVLEVVIHPEHREAAVVGRVLRSAVDRVIREGGRSIRIWTYLPAVGSIVEEIGFHLERQLLQMRLPLPPRPAAIPPNEVRVASFRVGTDETAWLELNNRAFAGHPENGSWTRAILADRMRQDWFDPEGILMVWQGSELVAFCWTKLHGESLGEIYVIAVDPVHQRKSLGTWLTLEGLWYLYREKKAATAMLYVDAATQSAVRMYERLGFGLDHVDRSYVRDV